jgi:hypothetical protein
MLYHYAECHILFIVMLIVVTLSVVALLNPLIQSVNHKM